VLALGGGAILDADTRGLLVGHRVVYLSMDVEEAVRRTGLNVARPLLAVNPRKQWRELMEARRHLYGEVAAAAVVATDGRTPDEVADKILAVLAGRAMDEYIAHDSTNGRNPLVIRCGWSSVPWHGNAE
ncbi:shikimate kinase, partial [Streptomyces sp. AF1A]|uniref:shikimate kinase n=1 Tax=Streptomyces sp. AF1A TaxID=3394350 RepID=UPI0039BCA117